MDSIDFGFGVSDRAGGGGYSTINILARVLKRMGYFVLEQRSVHSNIKGVRSSFYGRVADRPIRAPVNYLNLLFAFDQESLREDIGFVGRGGVLVADTSKVNPTPEGKPVDLSEFSGLIRARNLRIVEAPMAERAKQEFGNPIVRNTMALGMGAVILGIEPKIFYRFIENQYGDKKSGKKIVELNNQAFDIGFDLARQQIKAVIDLREFQDPGRLFILGNELMALGALAGGARFFAGYPITPSSEVFEMMIQHMANFGGVAIQAPSELAAASMIIGASYGGARSLTATSGPGFSLMQEALSGAGMSETPVVFVVVQRGGPGTGLPTRTSQEDLEMVLYGGHGEFSRIVLAPSTPEECFHLTAAAFGLAERYQCPIILLSEQAIGQTRFTVEDIDTSQVKIDRGKLSRQAEQGYERYAISDDGISTRAIPGLSAVPFMTSSNEHHPDGGATENIKMRNAQVEKRLKRMQLIRKDSELPPPVLYGDPAADIGLICFGSAAASARESLEILNERGVPVKLMVLRTLLPFSADEIRRFVKSCKRVYTVELNYTGQLRSLIQREVTGPLPRKLRLIRRYDGRPFRPLDIVREVLRGGDK